MVKARDEVVHPAFGTGEVDHVFVDLETDKTMMLVRFPEPPGRKPGSVGIFPIGVYPVEALPVAGPPAAYAASPRMQDHIQGDR